MSFPKAQILCFDDDQIAEASYDSLGHVQLYRQFLANPEQYLNSLLRDSDSEDFGE